MRVIYAKPVHSCPFSFSYPNSCPGSSNSSSSRRSPTNDSSSSMHSPSNSLISLPDSPVYSRSSSQESDAKLANSIIDQNVAKLGCLADVSFYHLFYLNSSYTYFIDMGKSKLKPELHCDRVSQSPG